MRDRPSRQSVDVPRQQPWRRMRSTASLLTSPAPSRACCHATDFSGAQPGRARAENRTLAHVRRMRAAPRMPKMIQVRSVPDRLHRELVRRARKRGRTVTSYIQEILEREVSRPPASSAGCRRCTDQCAARRGDRSAPTRGRRPSRPGPRSIAWSGSGRTGRALGWRRAPTPADGRSRRRRAGGRAGR